MAVSVDFNNPNAEPYEKVHNALCSKTWLWDGVTMEDGPKNQLDIGSWTSCWEQDYRRFQFMFQTFESPRNFSLTLNSRYRDLSYVFIVSVFFSACPFWLSLFLSGKS